MQGDHRACTLREDGGTTNAMKSTSAILPQVPDAGPASRTHPAGGWWCDERDDIDA